jgi:hypothetical protein
MAQTLISGLTLGASKTGLAASLKATLLDETGATIAGQVDIATAFIEVGPAGTYSWYYAGFPDSPRCMAVIHTGAWAGTPTKLVSFAINGEEVGGLTAATVSQIQSGLSTLNAAGVRTAVGLASANLDTQLAAIASRLPLRPTKNAALANFEFFLTSSTDHVSGKTGATVTATRSIDGGAFAACANAVSEVSSGVYKISLAASDLNGDVVTFRFTASGADDRVLTVVTQT